MSIYGTDYPEAVDPGPEDNPTQDDHAARLLALVRTGEWLDAQDFPPLRWAVHGIIPQGFGIFTGPPKAGKSWAAFGVGLAVAAGEPAFGKVPTGDPRPVLYLALEDGYARLQGRARHLLDEDQRIPAALHVVTRVTPADVLVLIGAWLAQHGHAAPLVLLDTLGKVMPPALPGEGAYQRDYRIGGRLKALADDHPGSTLLVVHHTRKLAGEDWMDSTSGTNGLNGAADFTLNLSRSRNESSGVLRVTGRDVAESEYAITSADGRWTLDGATLADAAQAAVAAKAAADLGDRSAEIVAYVAAQGGPVTPKAVEDALSLPDARRYLARMVAAGRLDKMGRGLYALPTPVPTVPSVPMEYGNGTTGQLGHLHVGDTECTVCGEPLHASLIELGESTHVGCL